MFDDNFTKKLICTPSCWQIKHPDSDLVTWSGMKEDFHRGGKKKT